jgi:N-acetylneuraminic acid mutarotase
MKSISKMLNALRGGKVTKRIFTMLLGLTVVVFASETFAQGAWTTEAPMPTARLGAVAEVVNGILYVAGGNNGTAGVASLEGYNPATNTWSSLAPMPSNRWLSEAGVINGQLYVVGGWGGGSCCPNTNLWVYDPPTNTWSSKASPPTRTAQGAAGVINGKLYVTTAANGFSGWRNFLHVYDPGTDGWTQLPNSPNVHVSPTAGVIAGKFYVAGGHDGIGYAGATDVYDPLTNIWTTVNTGAHGFYASASKVINGLLYAVGGNDGTAVVATVEVYDPVSNTWTPQASMPTARSFPAAGVVNGTLYAVGGSPSSGSPLATNEAFTPLVSFATFTPKVEITLGLSANDDMFTINATLTLGTSSDGIAPLTEAVTIHVGSVSATIPSGSFKLKPATKKQPAQFTFAGIINGVTLTAKIIPLGTNLFEFKAAGIGVELTGTVNPVKVGLILGDDQGSADVTANFIIIP